MKRQTAMALAAVFAMSVAGTALAAPANPFIDVPAKHWSYDAVSKLAQAGVISGYGDATFKGDRTITRYEMATMIAKAMANSDKADAATQKTIDALAAEYGSELNNLGVRVDNLEKNASKVKFTGEVRARYEYSDDSTSSDKSNELTRVRITMTAPIAENVTFKGRLHSQSQWGNSTKNNDVVLDQAYITGTVFDGMAYNFGRQPLYLGQGLLADASGNNDGLTVAAGKDVRLTLGATKSDIYNLTVANIGFKLSDNLNASVSYLADEDEAKYESTAAGFNYTGWDKFTVSGEYGQNDSDLAKTADGSKAKAYMGKVKYLGAKGNQAKSYGLWVGYRSAEPDFDTLGLGTLDMADTISGLKEADDVKGLEYGFNYALFNNGIMTLQYNDLESKDGKTDKKNFIAQLVYTF